MLYLKFRSITHLLNKGFRLADFFLHFQCKRPMGNGPLLQVVKLLRKGIFIPIALFIYLFTFIFSHKVNVVDTKHSLNLMNTLQLCSYDKVRITQSTVKKIQKSIEHIWRRRRVKCVSFYLKIQLLWQFYCKSTRLCFHLRT